MSTGQIIVTPIAPVNTYGDTGTVNTWGLVQTFTLAPVLSALTASKVVFTDASKSLTSTGIGTSSQFIKGDGSLDSSTYITSAGVDIVTAEANSSITPAVDGTYALPTSITIVKGIITAIS